MKITVETTHTPTQTKVPVSIEVGDDLVDAVSKFGHEAVYSAYIRGVRLSVATRAQAISKVRVSPVTLEEFIATMNQWTPETPLDNHAKKHRAQLTELLQDESTLEAVKERAKSLLQGETAS